MKNLIAILTLLSMLGFSSCIVDFDDDDWNGPACEYNYTGTVCFVNYTDRDIFIRTAGINLDVWAYSDQCLVLQDGFYSFYGQAGIHRWEGNFDVFVCEESRVYLDY